jgi:predicted GNAT family N-acyltransferase
MRVRCGNQAFEIGIAETAERREAAYALRMNVFVEEQRVPVDEELDAYDLTATHFLVREITADSGEDSFVGTARLVDKGGAVGKIGRVAIHASYRGLGLGAALMRYIHAFAGDRGFSRFDLEAQCYAIPFYEKLGYAAHGDIFLDAGIEHRNMTLNLANPSTFAGSNSNNQPSHSELKER